MSATFDIREEPETVGYLSRGDVEMSPYPEQGYSLHAEYARPDYLHESEGGDWPAPFNRRWVRPAAARLAELMKLRPGWDGASAKAVPKGSATAALVVLSRVTSVDSPPPWIVPLASGGVQLEWHEPGLTIEISLDPEHGNEMYLCTEEGAEHEGELTDASLAVIRQFVSRLAR